MNKLTILYKDFATDAYIISKLIDAQYVPVEADATIEDIVYDLENLDTTQNLLMLGMYVSLEEFETLKRFGFTNLAVLCNSSQDHSTDVKIITYEMLAETYGITNPLHIELLDRVLLTLNPDHPSKNTSEQAKLFLQGLYADDFKKTVDELCMMGYKDGMDTIEKITSIGKLYVSLTGQIISNIIAQRISKNAKAVAFGKKKQYNFIAVESADLIVETATILSNYVGKLLPTGVLYHGFIIYYRNQAQSGEYTVHIHKLVESTPEVQQYVKRLNVSDEVKTLFPNVVQFENSDSKKTAFNVAKNAIKVLLPHL